MRQIKKIIVHHSASSRDKTTPAQIHQWHVDRGWGLIGYHWVITGDGSLHVGRKESSKGIHTVGHNRDSIAICVTGNFETEEPTEGQWNMLKIWILRTLAGYGLTAKDLYTHRELSPTACCGENLHNKIDAWRSTL